MHFGHRDVLRRDPSLRVGSIPREPSRVMRVVVRGALAARLQHRRQYFFRPLLFGPQFLQPGQVAHNRRRRAITDRRAHRNSQRIGDRLRRQHFIDCERSLILR